MYTSGSDLVLMCVCVPAHFFFNLASLLPIYASRTNEICMVRILFMSIFLLELSYLVGQRNRQTLEHCLCSCATIWQRWSNTIERTSECFCHRLCVHTLFVFCTSKRAIICLCFLLSLLNIVAVAVDNRQKMLCISHRIASHRKTWPIF